MLFSYGNLEEGQELDWRGFWEGRISSKRALHLRHGLHDQRLEYSIDVEMGLRLAPTRARGRLPPRGAELHGAADRLRRVLAGATRRRAGRRRRSRDFTATTRSSSYAQIEGAVERWERARPDARRARGARPRARARARRRAHPGRGGLRRSAAGAVSRPTATPSWPTTPRGWPRRRERRDRRPRDARRSNGRACAATAAGERRRATVGAAGGRAASPP